MKQAEEFFDPEKEWNELHEGTGSEEDPWASVGMDDAEETLPQEQDAGKDACGDSNLGQDQEGRRLTVEEWPPEENPAPRMRWSLPCGCNFELQTRY